MAKKNPPASVVRASYLRTRRTEPVGEVVEAIVARTDAPIAAVAAWVADRNAWHTAGNHYLADEVKTDIMIGIRVFTA